MDMLIAVLLEEKQQTFSPEWGITAPIPSGLSSPGNFATRAPLYSRGTLDPAVPGAPLPRLLRPRYQAQPRPLPSHRGGEKEGDEAG